MENTCNLWQLNGQAASTKLIDDFADGDDEGWVRVDLLQPFGLGQAVFDAGSTSYEISSADIVPPLPPGAGCTGAGSFWLPSADGARDIKRFSNGTVQATFTFNNDISNGFIGLRSDVETLSLYDFAVNNGGDSMIIDRLVNGISVTGGPGLASVPFDFASGQQYVVEATAVGPHLSMKVWAVGDEEPDDPQLSLTDHALTSGGVSVAAYYCEGFGGDLLSSTFDDIRFTPGNSAFGADARSAVAIPEPGGFIAVLIGIAGLGLRRKCLSG